MVGFPSLGECITTTFNGNCVAPAATGPLWGVKPGYAWHWPRYEAAQMWWARPGSVAAYSSRFL